jgi:hypothetical protein
MQNRGYQGRAANADRRGMSRFGDRVKRNTRQNWPSMALVVAAALASVLFGPFIGLAAALGAWGLYEYRRRRQIQD